MAPDPKHQPEPTNPHPNGIKPESSIVISKIEDIFTTIVKDAFQGGRDVQVPFMSRASKLGKASQESQETGQNTILPGKISFPGSTPQEAWRFGMVSCLSMSITSDWHVAVTVCLLSLVHEALVNDVVLTKRCCPVIKFP